MTRIPEYGCLADNLTVRAITFTRARVSAISSGVK
jgi:hypothetical protein